MLSLQDIMRWSEDEAREFLEAMRWPNGPVCPKCGAADPYRITRKTRTKNHVRKLFKCRQRECRRQFSTTVGTIFEDSKVPLHKWLAVMYLMCSSKKGISAHQVHRTIGVAYQTAWFMCHRIRGAMNDDTGGRLEGVVEVDETYFPRSKRGHPVVHERIKDEVEMGLRPQPPRRPPYQDLPTVFGMIERGGRVRSQVVENARRETLRPIIMDNVDADKTLLVSDRHPAYRDMSRSMSHETVNHEIEYVREDMPEIHTQNIENYWSIFKRGVHGTFHHISVAHMQMYLNEFDFRASRREFSDAERFCALMSQLRGRLLWYCRTPQKKNPYA